MKAFSSTRVNVFMLAVLCVITSGLVRNAGATPVDGFIDPNLPPVHPNPDVAYHSDEEGYVYYPASGIVITDIVHGNFTDIGRSYSGNDEIESFDSVLTTSVEVPGMGMYAAELTGPVSTKVYNKAGNTLGTWNTEIVSMAMTGSIGGVDILIRESPTLSSIGITSVESGSNFRIDSFFDVFTELSVDGGQTWMPSEGSCRMTLVPEPTTICLFVFGGLGVLSRRRR